MSKEFDPVIRSFARIYPRRKDITLGEALNIIMEEVCGGEKEITEEMLRNAEKGAELKRGWKRDERKNNEANK